LHLGTLQFSPLTSYAGGWLEASSMPKTLGRRRFPRFEIHIPFLYTGSAPISTSTGVGWTRSLSQGGATVELSERLRPRTPIQLRLRAPQAIAEAEAEVIWSGGPAREGGGLVHGLLFTRIAPDHMQVLREACRPLVIMRHAGVRLPLEIPVTCRSKNLEGSQLQGRTGNVNRGGLFLRLPRLLPPGTPLEVTLHTPEDPLTVDGGVVWVEPPEIWSPGESIGHGFQFHAPNWSTLASLALLLLELS
jgi:hypothetical protein